MNWPDIVGRAAFAFLTLTCFAGLVVAGTWSAVKRKGPAAAVVVWLVAALTFTGLAVVRTYQALSAAHRSPPLGLLPATLIISVAFSTVAFGATVWYTARRALRDADALTVGVMLRGIGVFYGAAVLVALPAFVRDVAHVIRG